jgi:hypothetical protein
MSRRQDWPQEIRPNRMLGNFRDIDRVKAPKTNAWRKRRDGNDPKYLDAIRSLGCILGCCDPGVRTEAHHLKGGEAAKHRGVFLKAPDKFAVPLCVLHHNEIERLSSMREEEFFAARSVSVHLFAKQAWRSWETFGDVKKLEGLFVVHQQQAIQKLKKLRGASALRSARGAPGSSRSPS